MKMVIKMEQKIIDGNTACALMSYMFTEACGIYPITPASSMAENVDVYAANGMKNFFGETVKVIEMQSEAGAIAAVHGMLQNGVLATTYTASQGLLLMLPNMYKIAGEMLPCVIHVAARTIATHALSIMGDHSDIYAARPTGFALLSSSSTDDIMIMTALAHLAAIKGRVPFLHFFDGFRTSHEYNKINVPDFDKIKALIDQDAITLFRKNSLDIANPTTRGTNQGDQMYFQQVEARNKYYDALPDVVESYLEKLNAISKTDYQLFNYYGDKKATKVIVAMGSVCETIKEFLDYKSKGLGLIEVHLYRPFSKKHLLKALPKTVKKIAVLDRTKEAGSSGEPLYLDIVEFVKSLDLKIEVVGGRYGLSSKNTNLNDIEAIYDYLNGSKLHKFTVGIVDDVTNLSLTRTKTKFPKKDEEEILIYGYGSDGMVTTSKDILTIIGNNTQDYVQGYFEYDSKKSGGVTKCHLRFSKQKIKSTYYVENPKMVICSKDTYLTKYEVLKGIKEGGVFLLNTEHDKDTLKEILPQEVIKILKEKKIKFYTINASKIARENNIPNKISMIMEMAILHLMNRLPLEEVTHLMNEQIEKNFRRKGEEIVNSNKNALKEATTTLEEVDVSSLQSDLVMEKVENSIFSMLEHAKGDEIPVSMFADRADGIYEPGLSKLEKRGLSNIVPFYNNEKCISCNFCSFVCPHGVIRPYLLSKEEYENAPEIVKKDCKETKIKDEAYYFTVGISPMDCTGCGLCANACPTIALAMQDMESKKDELLEKYAYLSNRVSYKNPYKRTTVKGSQFERPLFEFHGACAGCGETPYLKLLTQLFKDRLIIANATGCSSIYGASLPNTPYSVPWINSLFEDNAEFGYGIRIAEDKMHEKIANILKANKDKVSSKNKELIEKYLAKEEGSQEEFYDNFDFTELKELEPLKKFIKDKSIWLVGGDGWAYDIGYGGIDHVIANKENVNILVLDTEVYSNTGGQASKSTRMGAVAKFAAAGKKTNKKDLARIALTNPDVYVATISLGANFQQTINALEEASNYNGPSLVIAYSPCIAHGIKKGMENSIKEEKLATESGYFPLFRYNPATKEFHLDSKADFSKYEEMFKNENRYRIVSDLLEQNKENAIRNYEELESLQASKE